jgi:SAM-dependent methyltransferase
VFVNDFLLSGWLAALSAFRSRRPDIALVCVAGHAERFMLWREFEGYALPPLVLRDPSPAAIVYDALRIAHDALVTEQLDHSVAPLVAAGPLSSALAELSSMMGAPGVLRDHAFDRLLPIRLRAASDQFWTPLEVVRRAASWFEELGLRTVVDVGSGVGKFCIAGALLGSCHYVGIEQRPQLVAVARNLARLLAVDERVSIIGGRFGDVETPTADCYYFYNPFEENLFPAGEGLDGEVELSRELFRADLRCFRALVTTLPPGAHILTYNGVGGRLPDCLHEVRVERSLPAPLRLFEKVGRRGSSPEI